MCDMKIANEDEKCLRLAERASRHGGICLGVDDGMKTRDEKLTSVCFPALPTYLESVRKCFFFCFTDKVTGNRVLFRSILRVDVRA